MGAASSAGLTDREVRVETPEHVAVGYRLADLGSRFTALLIDGVIIIGALLALWLGVPLLITSVFDSIPPALAGWGLGTLTLVSFTLSWGYFVYFEGFRDGQTPGKRWMGIRVVHDGGYPLTLQGAAIRNLLRAIDSQPAFTWLVGGATMLIHPGTKRLGDLAAGTVVVREQSELVLPEEAGEPGAAVGPPRLDEGEFAALSGYLARRAGLAAETRTRIAGKLAAHLERHAEWDRRGRSADAFLLAVHQDEAARRTAAGAAGRAGNARAITLVRQQQPAWRDLRSLIVRAGGSGLHALPEADVSRFAALYRETSADLARARTYGGSRELIYTLERLVGAGHNLLYRPPRHGLRRAGQWVASGFPSLVRRRWRPIVLAAGFLYVPALLAFAAARMEPGWVREVLPVGMIARAEEGVQREVEGLGYVEVEDVFMPVMASGLIANNVQVTFIAFAGGVLAGIGTVLVLVLNGVFLGAAAGLFANHGISLYLWTFVLPHGVIELTAIAIAGGAGLWLGSAILLPGRLTRREAMERRGREAVSLIAGTTLLLLAAGVIEGFISPSPLPREIKLLLAALFAAALAAYLLGGGRRSMPPVVSRARPPMAAS
jgi:uncharacterized membrane protein SpoIIM required for sporulation/uncharacterized RDD family membrane protein YckC